MKSKVAAVRCESYKACDVRNAVSEAIAACGGFPQKVLRAKKILIKPNLLTAREPDGYTTTHPEVVRALVCEIRKAVAEPEIFLGDSSASPYTHDELWEKTGMKDVAEEEKITLLPFENIKNMDFSGGIKIPVLREYYDMDAVITVPKLKTHSLTKTTGAVKNSFGLVVGLTKSSMHSRYPSPRKMARFIATLYGLLKTDFAVMDAVVSMAGAGPADGVPFNSSVIIVGEDAVAVDSVASRLYGYGYGDVPVLDYAEKLGLGNADPDRIELLERNIIISKITTGARSKADFLHGIPDFLFNIISPLLASHPCMDRNKCIRCGKCFNICSRKAIKRNADGYFKVRNSKCILCMCCVESCPVHAIELKSPYWKIKEKIKRMKN